MREPLWPNPPGLALVRARTAANPNVSCQVLWELPFEFSTEATVQVRVSTQRQSTGPWLRRSTEVVDTSAAAVQGEAGASAECGFLATRGLHGASLSINIRSFGC